MAGRQHDPVHPQGHRRSALEEPRSAHRQDRGSGGVSMNSRVEKFVDPRGTHLIRCYSLDMSKVFGFLAVFDPDDPIPNGTIEFTDKPGKALRVKSAGDAVLLWNLRSETHPTRETDGGANKPLTAFSAEVIPIEDAL